jgi:exosortase E/protease (VPEID-CTERM system)
MKLAAQNMMMPPTTSRTRFASRSFPGDLPWWHWCFCLGLLGSEWAFLQGRFDLGSLWVHWSSTRPHMVPGWIDFLARLHWVPRTVLTAVAATLLLGAPRLLGALRTLASARPACQRSMRWFLGLHLICFVGYWQLTALLFETDFGYSRVAAGWVLVRACLGVSSLLFWIMLCLPVQLWRALLQALWPALAGGVTFAALAALFENISRPLGRCTLAVVQLFLGLVCQEVVCDRGNHLVGTKDFCVQVGAGCCGLEGIGLVWLFLIVFLYLFREYFRFPQVLLLFPLGTTVIWLANSLRITALIAVGTWLSPEVAVKGFHSQAGWVAFLLSACVLGLLAFRLPFFKARPDSAAVSSVTPTTSQDSTPAYLLPLLTILGISMITGAFVANVDWLYPARVLGAVIVLVLYRRSYQGIPWNWSWYAVAAGAGIFTVWLILAPAAQENPAAAELAQHGTAAWPGTWFSIWLVFRVLGAVVTVPIAEELAFRGYLLRRLQSSRIQDIPVARFTWFSFIASSLLFGIVHGCWLAGTVAGLAFAALLYRRRNLAEPILAHAVANALIAAYVLATGSWALWV